MIVISPYAYGSTFVGGKEICFQNFRSEVSNEVAAVLIARGGYRAHVIPHVVIPPVPAVVLPPLKPPVIVPPVSHISVERDKDGKKITPDVVFCVGCGCSCKRVDAPGSFIRFYCTNTKCAALFLWRDGDLYHRRSSSPIPVGLYKNYRPRDIPVWPTW